MRYIFILMDRLRNIGKKMNFYLFCQQLAKYGIGVATWTFSESGHGKGEADGIGGSLKRKADRMIVEGKHITNANEFYATLKEDSE